eukprot:14242494-Alexandrium_andersonii.AAC.1
MLEYYAGQREVTKAGLPFCAAAHVGWLGSSGPGVRRIHWGPLWSVFQALRKCDHSDGFVGCVSVHPAV